MIEVIAMLTPNYFADDRIELRVIDREKHRIAVPLTLEPYEPTDPLPLTVAINKTGAQVLIDSLWSCGLRPTEGQGSVGQLGSTERHLADLKQIAFHALKIKE